MAVRTAVPELAELSAFRKHLNRGMESLAEAARVYAGCVRKNPEVKTIFAKEFPQFSGVMWERMEKVGSGTMHKALLCDGSYASDRVRALPYSDQCRVLDKGVPVLMDDGAVRIVRSQDLTPEMVSRVIAKTYVRTPEQQKLYIESCKVTAAIREAQPRNGWRVLPDGRLEVWRGTVLTAAEVKSILKDMKKRAGGRRS